MTAAALLLAAYLATQAWSWEPVAGATSYRVYYGGAPAAWCPMQYAAVPSSACTATECQLEVQEPTGDLIFFNVTAINADGESVWDHGVKVCP